jgi:hypothetical protein
LDLSVCIFARFCFTALSCSVVVVVIVIDSIDAMAMMEWIGVLACLCAGV